LVCVVGSYYVKFVDRHDGLVIIMLLCNLLQHL